MFEGKAEERSDSWDRGICSGYIHVEGHVTLNKQTEQVDLTVVNCRYKSQKKGVLLGRPGSPAGIEAGTDWGKMG